MRNKIVMITAALAVMMALTGIAAAGAPSISPSVNVQIPDDSIGGTSDLTIGWIYDGSDSTNHILTWKLLQSDGVTPTTDLNGSTDNFVTFGNSGTFTATTGTPTITLKVKDNVVGPGNIGTKYAIQVSEPASLPLKVDMTIGVIVIPEFATVAIPIAAVLGLVFFFQQRKNKKE